MGMQSSSHPRSLTFGRINRHRRICFCACLAPCLLVSLLFSPKVPAQAIQATSAPLLLPTTVIFDQSGNLYLAETNRHVVDRIDSSGVLSVVAGNGTQGYSGDTGPATSAQLDSPQGVAVDAAGNLYIADTHNHRIRRVAAGTGVISTVAGVGTPGFSGDQGQASAAQLRLPTALALDNRGNLAIADSNNHRIRQLDLSSGILRTVAGNGIQADAGDGASALNASIDTPTGLAFDASGNLYLADTHNHRVRRVGAADGVITTEAGGGSSFLGTSSSATLTKLFLPRGLSFDSAGNLYLADTQTHRILRVTPDGGLSIVAGEGTQGFAGNNGPAVAALLDSPRSAAVSPGGLVTLADTGNKRLRQVDANGVITSFGGIGTASALTLISPASVQYGTGSLGAMVVSGTPATGSVGFFENVNGMLTSLGVVPLTSNAASFSTAHLAAGSHQVSAEYGGDPANALLESNTVLLTVVPALVSVSIDSASTLFGQAIPMLLGSLEGVLPQDAGLVSATFSTTAASLSPAAIYPISVTLTGPSAENYQIGSVSTGSLVISQAPTATALTASSSSLAQGVAVSLSARTLSTTQGVPSGQITFFDSGASIGSSALDATGAAVLSASLGLGTHSVTAIYSGSGNFLSSSSAAVSAVVSAAPNVSPDFTLNTSGTSSQTASAGASVNYAFAVSVLNGPLSSPILLTAAGMPSGAMASFSPTYLPPGGAVSSFTLTVLTAKASTAQRRTTLAPTWAVLIWGIVALAPLGVGRRRGQGAGYKQGWWLLGIIGVVALGSVAGCGNSITALPKAASTMSVYPMTVTATSTSSTGAVLQHTASVMLTLQ